MIKIIDPGSVRTAGREDLTLTGDFFTSDVRLVIHEDQPACQALHRSSWNQLTCKVVPGEGGPSIDVLSSGWRAHYVEAGGVVVAVSAPENATIHPSSLHELLNADVVRELRGKAVKQRRRLGAAMIDRALASWNAGLTGEELLKWRPELLAPEHEMVTAELMLGMAAVPRVPYLGAQRQLQRHRNGMGSPL